MPRTKAHHILIVEDDARMAEMLDVYLRNQGYATTATAWGEDAVALARELPADLVLLDIRLPGIDGYEVYQRLRRQHSTRHTPVLFLTDQRARENRLAGLELGAVDYIAKPFDIEELGLRLRNALHRASRAAPQNPVTGLPDGAAVLQQLQSVLRRPRWALVLVRLTGLDGFRRDHGFVAADDALRSVGVILSDLVANGRGVAGEQQILLGHLDPETLVILTDLRRCRKLADNSRSRLQNAVPLFYPAEPGGSPPISLMPGQLNVSVRCLTSDDGAFPNPQAILTAI